MTEYRGFWILDEKYKERIDELLEHGTIGGSFTIENNPIYPHDICIMTRLRHASRHTCEENAADVERLILNQLKLVENMDTVGKRAEITSNVLFPTMSELKPIIIEMCAQYHKFKKSLFKKLVELATEHGLEAALYLMYDIFPEFMTEECHLTLYHKNGVKKTIHPTYDWHKEHVIYMNKMK